MVETIFKFCTVVAEAVMKGVEYNQLKAYALDLVAELRKAATEIQRQGNIIITYSDRIHYLEQKIKELEEK